MKQIIIDPEFWNLFPAGQINILRLEGIDNQVDEKDDPYFQKLLDDATEESKQFLTNDNFA